MKLTRTQVPVCVLYVLYPMWCGCIVRLYPNVCGMFMPYEVWYVCIAHVYSMRQHPVCVRMGRGAVRR